MAKDRKQPTTEKKGVQKPSLIERVKETFRGIRRELKRVVWPNKKTMRENTTAVLVITIAVTLLLFFTDTIMVRILDAAGFNVVEIESPIATPATTPVTDDDVDSDVSDQADEDVDNEDAVVEDESVVDESVEDATDSPEESDESAESDE